MVLGGGWVRVSPGIDSHDGAVTRIPGGLPGSGEQLGLVVLAEQKAALPPSGALGPGKAALIQKEGLCWLPAQGDAGWMGCRTEVW